MSIGDWLFIDEIVFRVDARAAQEQKAVDAVSEGRFDHIGFDHQILIDEIGRLGVIGVDTADQRGRQKYGVD